MTKVLFVCHGNICRSPLAEFLLKKETEERKAAERFEIASAGTSSEEYGNPVYPPVKRYLASKNISCAGKRAVRVTKRDTEYYDFIICMENVNVRNLLRMFPECDKDKIFLLRDFPDLVKGRPAKHEDIEDPWYTDNFEKVFAQIEEGCSAAAEYLLEKDN